MGAQCLWSSHAQSAADTELARPLVVTMNAAGVTPTPGTLRLPAEPPTSLGRQPSHLQRPFRTFKAPLRIFFHS